MRPILFHLLAICIYGRTLSNASSASEIETDPLVVKTASGFIEGLTVQTALGKAVDAFLGIPYGATTSGTNRFSPPKETTAWEGTFQAKSLPDSCIQALPHGKLVRSYWKSNFPETEDCLKLNIWVPKPRKRNIPVLLWIHGGGLQASASNLDLYNGAVLASEEEIIVMSINYRLSAFGFLYFDHPDAPGNVGLMDQAAALRWVQRNIENFGGDPNRVTLSGQSLGAGCVGVHLFLPSSRDLFKRAILQSGVPTSLLFTRSKKEMLSFSLELANKSGCVSNKMETDKIIQCLQSKETSNIQSVLQNMSVQFMPFVPVIDQSFLPSHPEVLLHQNINFNISEIMLGNLMYDGIAFLKLYLPEKKLTNETFFTAQDISKITKLVVRHTCNVVVSTVRYHYTDWEDPENPEKIRNLLIHFLTDFFLCAENDFSRQFSANGIHVYKYLFNHKPSTSQSPAWTGLVHGEDIQFVFGLPLDPSKSFTEEEKTFSRNVMHYWANFVKFGNPNAGSHELFNWPRYTPRGKASLELSPKPKVLNGYRHQECAFWDRVLPKMKALFNLP